MVWCDTYAKQVKQQQYEGRLILNIIKCMILAKILTKHIFLYT